MFSFDDYREIIRIIKASGRQATYAEALGRDSFVIMRHDVEYSVERALALSRVEESMDFRSHYFFQWTNNSYNILSRKNRDILKEMHERLGDLPGAEEYKERAGNVPLNPRNRNMMELHERIGK